MTTEGRELSLIDCGIQSLQDVPLREQLLVLNLHSNYIQRIEHLTRLSSLVHLDLSSNQISHIQGLDGLVSLRTLNLSCNLITEVTGLSPLRSLVKINLSYNQIESIEGFSSLTGPQYKVSHIELHGNKLRSLTHVTQALIGCFNLRHLVLSQDGSGNPICHQPGYPGEMLSSLPHLKCLDGKDRSGRPVDLTHILTDIPGLEDYMDFLESRSSSDHQLSDMITPKIDQALAAFRHRHVQSGETSMVSSSDVEPSPAITRSSPNIQADSQSCQEQRLQQLEDQLAKLLQTHQPVPPADTSNIDGPAQVKGGKQQETGSGETEDSDATIKNSKGSGKRSSRKLKKSKVPTYMKSTRCSRAKSEERQTGTTSSSVGEEGGDSPGGQQTETEKRGREDIKSTYVHLMQELEGERERRWKAEQAAKKLADHIRSVQTKAKEDSETKTTALEATGHLKKVLMNEREAKIRLQEENQDLKDRISEMTEALSRLKESENNQKMAVQSLEDAVRKQERERVQQQTHEMKKLQETQMKAAAMTREAEMLRHTTESQKGQLNQLRELLATREQEHRSELKQHYSLGSPELQQLIQQEAQRVSARHEQELQSYTEKIDVLTSQYSDLEDEFRLALQIEANRFSELQREFERTARENAECQQKLTAVLKKEERSAGIITELTAMVKEQKGRITELSKSKHEQNVDFRERVSNLEAHVEEARKRMVQLELLKKEKTRLTAEVQGQESVIQGLKAERKLWGQELAQQGASLAQDRGRLESKIEILTQENNSLKKQLERETDGLKIKSKVIDDQTETIRRLKEGVLDRDNEIKKAREDALKTQQDLEAQLLEERTANQDTQEEVERLQERKEELKQQLACLREELEQSQNAHSVLSKRWKEKSSLIGQLEQQVQQMKESWEGKERTLTQERNKAIQAADLAIEKLRGMDDGFRKQLESKEQSHREEMALLHAQKQQELAEANRRVELVEEEMRTLLRETESNKKKMEDKVRHMTQALGEIQSNLF